ncbi:MAG: hypothetical protein AAGD38_18275 [Acidobacteriota bacterium]
MGVKEVLTQHSLAAEVAGAAARHAPAIAPDVAAWLIPPNGQTLDWQLVFETVGDFLDRRCAEILDYDEAHQADLDHEQLLRLDRDQAYARTRARLIQLRDLLKAHYGKRAVTILPIGATARTPSKLWQQTRQIINRLHDPDLTFPPSTIADLPPDPQIWATDLQSQADQLGATLDALRAVARAKEMSLITRRQMVTTFDQHISGAINILEGLFKIAGATELAARVRPTTPRARRASEEESEEESAETSIVGGEESIRGSDVGVKDVPVSDRLLDHVE